MSVRLAILRGAYLMGAIAALVLGLAGNRLIELFQPMSPDLAAMKPAMIAPLIFLVGFMLFLAARPYWWGKLFVLWPALSWFGFAAAMSGLLGWSDALMTPILCAGTMLLISVIHQIVDPRFSGQPLS